MREKEGVVWELGTRLEEQGKVLKVYEEAQDKKKKRKIECVLCLKKEAEVQQLTLKIEKIKADQAAVQVD